MIRITWVPAGIGLLKLIKWAESIVPKIVAGSLTAIKKLTAFFIVFEKIFYAGEFFVYHNETMMTQGDSSL